MFLDQKTIDERVNSPDNLVNNLGKNSFYRIVKHQGGRGGRTKGTENRTAQEREDIGVVSRLAGPQIASELFGVHPTQASNLAHGRQGSKEDSALKAGVEKRIGVVREKVEERAADRLLTAINFLDDDKLANSSAKDLASIASNLSRTLQNVNPRVSGTNGKDRPAVNINIYAPKQASEEHFETIDIHPE